MVYTSDQLKQFREEARKRIESDWIGDDDLEVDDDAEVEDNGDGSAWVMAWIRIPVEES